MKKEKSKSKIGTYILGFFLILCLVCLLTLKETTLLKKVICCNKDKCAKSQDQFEITNNINEIVEKQVTISIDEAGEIKDLEEYSDNDSVVDNNIDTKNFKILE